MSSDEKRIIPEPSLSRSRKLRKDQTPWEVKLWYHLRANRFYSLPFKRQVEIGSYIVDFSCKSKMIIVELDGGNHNSNKDYDKKRDAYLKSLGYKVLRFWNNDIDRNMPGVLADIKMACKI